MGVTSGKITSGTSNYTRFYLSWQQTSQSTAENKTYISWQVGIEATTATASWYSNAIKVYDVYINGTKVSSGGTWGNKTVSPNNPIQLLNGTAEIPHNNDGTKTFNANFTAWLYSNFNTSANGDFTLNTIPRQTSITSFSVNKRDETSVVYSYTTSDACDWAWYSKDNGSTWNTLPNSNIITGLSPNTSYNFKLRVRRTDSQMTTDSGTVAQSTYAIPTQSLKSKTETSITMNWSIDSTANYIWYTTNGNASSPTWVAVGSVNATSGSYTISGLTANNTYNIRTKIRRASTNTTYENGTSTLSVKTHQYPYVDTVQTANLTVGSSQKVTLYNPLSRNVTVYMKQNNTSGTTLYSGTTSGTSLTFTPNATTLYNSIPNSTSGSAVYYCTYSSQTVQTKSGTYAINNSQGQHNPTFALSNWSYTANQTSLTNNNQVVINGKSTVTFTVNTAATAKDGTTIDYYLFEWGTINKKSTDGNTLSNGNGNILKVTAFDKRGYYTQTTLNLGNNYVDYKNIIGTAATQRQDGVEANTNLDISGSLFYQTFGSSGVQNEFVTAKYWASTSSTYSGDGYSIPVSNFTYSNNNYYLNDYIIHANGSSGGFTVGTRYNIKITLTDKLTTTTIYTTVTDGKIAEDTFQDSNGEYHRGINGLADSDYTLKVHGKFNATGGVYDNGTRCVTANDIAGKYDTSQLGLSTFKVTRNASRNSKGYGYWAAMLNSAQAGSPVLPSASKWWHVISMDWNGTTDNATSWISQLALPTNDGGVPYYRKNNNASTAIDSSTWHWFMTDENWRDKVYPVGSVYISYKATSPASLFGGTWEQLKNHFLFATNATSGDKGGTGNGTGTSTSQNNNNTGSTTLTAAQSGLPAHSHQHKGYRMFSRSTLDTTAVSWGDDDDANGSWTRSAGGTNASQGHTHTLGNHSHTIPYIEVYVWRRTA